MTTESDISLEDTSSFTGQEQTLASKIATLEILSLNKTDLFTKEECEKIQASCIEDLWLPSKVIGEKSLHKSTRQKLRGEIAGFPFDNIRSVTKTVNDDIYDFRLLGIIDQDFPQVFKYAEGDYYNWHMEINPMAPSRKLSFIVNLSDPADYEGGEIEFLNMNSSSFTVNEQGSCLVFPSFLTYKINPVTKGSKQIIVGHVHGALFR
jgi:PKHD-type hydroxylase